MLFISEYEEAGVVHAITVLENENQDSLK